MNTATHAKEYWEKKFTSSPSKLNFPIDQVRPVQYSFDSKIYSMKMTSKGLEQLVHTKKEKSSVLLAAFLLWIYRNTNETHLIIGKSWKNNSTIQTLILPFAYHFDKDESNKHFLEKIEKQMQDDQKNLCFQIVSCLSELDSYESISYPAVFHESLEDGICLNSQSLSKQTDLLWNVIKQNGEFLIQVEYNSLLFTENTIQRFIQQYEKILISLLSDVDTQSIQTINLLTAEEQKLYKNINNSKMHYRSGFSIPELFLETVNRFPNRVALASDQEQLSYQELHERSNRLANQLIANGLKKGDFVSIVMERSLETVISIIAILKAGGTYVPIDPSYPKERCKFLLEDTNSAFVLTKKKYIDFLQNLTSEHSTYTFFFIDESMNEYSAENIAISIQPEDIAYIIYTSGSTGKPKGVLLTHENVANLVASLFEIFKTREHDVYTQFFSFSFDPSVAETFMALLSGAKLHILSELERISIEDFAVAIHKVQATGIILPTAFFNQLSMHLSASSAHLLQSIKRISMGGEALLGSMVRQWQEKIGSDMEIINFYGPTECTVISTASSIKKLIPIHQTSIPIGKPIGNYEVFILNEHNHSVPVNVPGELCIGGIGVAKGYWNRPEKTDEVFIPHPYSKDSNERLYKTGDIVRLLNDGSIEFIGRKDSQIKIRGFRIEIGEIEDVLTRHPDINEAIVIPKKAADNNNSLYAFYTIMDGAILNEGKIRDHLNQNIPEYMVPSAFFHLAEMPLAPTGKVDRKALSIIDVSAITRQNHVDSTSLIQTILAEAWKEVLGIQGVGIHDDFFHIGGHSLKILQILVQLKKHYPFIKIQDFYKYRTIAEMEDYILQKKTTSINISQSKSSDWKTKDLIEPPALSYLEAFPSRATDKDILLTGTTGYLGSHLLYELLKQSSSIIYCLIRKKENEISLKRLENVMQFYFGNDVLKYMRNRIVIIDGDLSAEQLGLTEDIRKNLIEKVNCIIHCGADVRHFGDASHFNNVNRNGTSYLLELAKQKTTIEFHHISTIGIPEELATNAAQWQHFEKHGDFSYEVSLDNVYIQSKMDAELLVLKAAKERVPVTVYRVGNLSCHSQTGLFQSNMDENAFYRMLKAILYLKKAPIVDWYVDITPVDYTSKGIIALALSNKYFGHTFHLCNPVQIPFTQLISSIQALGYEIELMELKHYEEWLLHGPHTEDIQPYLPLAIAQLEGEGPKHSEIRFHSLKTEQALAELDYYCPIPNQRFIQVLIEYGIKSGYFPEVRKPVLS